MFRSISNGEVEEAHFSRSYLLSASSDGHSLIRAVRTSRADALNCNVLTRSGHSMSSSSAAMSLKEYVILPASHAQQDFAEE